MLGEAYGYMASLSSSTYTTTGRQKHGQYQSQQIKTSPESVEHVQSVPSYSVCASQSPVGDRMSMLEQRLDSYCDQFQYW